MLTLQRRADWPERLAALVSENRGRPFAWGGHDCVCFSAAAVEALTGTDPLGVTWVDRREAARVLREMGGLVAAVDTVLPRRESPAFAQRGDIVLVRSKRPWLAVCDGGRCWAPGKGGLVSYPMADAVIAWRV